MKSIAILGLFALIVLVSGFQYNIEVKLGDTYFEPVNGTLKLYIHRGWSKDMYRLNETVLANRRTYVSRHEVPLTIDKVQNATFYWTLSSPIPPKYYFNKPSIYLQHVKVVPSYIQNLQFRESESKYFCPTSSPMKIKHKEEIKLRKC